MSTTLRVLQHEEPYPVKIGNVVFWLSDEMIARSTLLQRLKSSDEFKQTGVFPNNILMSRSAKLFEVVADFLRSGSLYLPKDIAYKQVDTELNFYGARSAPEDAKLKAWTHDLTHTILVSTSWNFLHSMHDTSVIWSISGTLSTGEWQIPFPSTKSTSKTAIEAALQFIEFLKTHGWKAKLDLTIPDCKHFQVQLWR